MNPIRTGRTHSPPPPVAANRPSSPPPGPVPASPTVSSPPGSPPPEFFHDGFLRDLGPLPPRAPVSPPGEFLAAGFDPGQSPPPSPQTRPHDWFRPDSPTYRVLQDNADLELLLSNSQGPRSPAGVRPMTREQAEAAAAFRSGIEAADPSGASRFAGEFGQTFHREGGRLVPTIPIHYEPGTALTFPPGSVDGRTAQMIHSHPGGPEYHFPSDVDYLSAYFTSRGNSGALDSGMIYHPGTDRFYSYQPRLDAATNRPRYFELSEPGDPPPAKRARTEGGGA